MCSTLPQPPHLAPCAAAPTLPPLQSAVTVGSFSYGTEDGLKAILAQDGVRHLLRALSSQDERVVEAASRSLKFIYQVGWWGRGGVARGARGGGGGVYVQCVRGQPSP